MCHTPMVEGDFHVNSIELPEALAEICEVRRYQNSGDGASGFSVLGRGPPIRGANMMWHKS